MAKIAILHEVLGRSKGGIEAWIYHVSEELQRQGHEVTLFNTMAQVPADAAPPGIEVVSVPRRMVSPSVFFLRAIYNGTKFFKGRLTGFDAVWARSFGMAWIAGRSLPYEKAVYVNAAPYAFYLYTPFIECLRREKGIRGAIQAVSSQLSYVVSWFFEKAAIKRCTNVFLSKERKNQTLGFFRLQDSAEKHRVIPAGVDIRRFYPSGAEWDGKAPLKIIAACRLARDKNVQCILQALAILKGRGRAVFLTVAGEGEYEETLKRQTAALGVGDQVLFAGRKEDIESWYRENHLFVLPSLYEGFGNVYVEAMASGLPCIAISSKSGEFSVAADEIIDHGENGLLMTKNDAEELADLISELYVSPGKLAAWGRHGRDKAVRVFSWEKTVKDLLEISGIK